MWLFDTKVTFLNINIGEVLRSRFLFFTFTELFFKHGVKIFNDQDQGRTFLDISGVLRSRRFFKYFAVLFWIYRWCFFGSITLFKITPKLLIEIVYFQKINPFKNKNRGNKSKTTFFTFLTLLFKRSR